jgi:hypothetical protein
MNRLSLIGRKASGRHPVLTWWQLAGLMWPGRVWTSKLREEASGPCPVLWCTNLGEFWGRADDRDLLQFFMREQLDDSVYQEPRWLSGGGTWCWMPALTWERFPGSRWTAAPGW